MIESHGETVRKIPGEENEQVNYFVQKMVNRFENTQYVHSLIQFDDVLKQQGINVYQNNGLQMQGRQVAEMNAIQGAAPVA